MKKFLAFAGMLLSLLLISSCDKDEEEPILATTVESIEEIDQTHIEVIKVIAVTEELLKYFDVNYVYSDLDGKEHTVILDKNSKWTKTKSESGLQVETKFGTDFIYSEIIFSSDEHDSCDLFARMTFDPKYKDDDHGTDVFYGEFAIDMEKIYHLGAFSLDKNIHTKSHTTITHLSNGSSYNSGQSSSKGGTKGSVGKEVVVEGSMAFNYICDFKGLTLETKTKMSNEEWTDE